MIIDLAKQMWNLRPRREFYEIKKIIFYSQNLKGNLYSVKQDEVMREPAGSILKEKVINF